MSSEQSVPVQSNRSGFPHLQPANNPVPDGYGGLDWTSFRGVDDVTIVSSGGFSQGSGGTGSEFVMDDLTLTETPEPGAVSLLLLGTLLGARRLVRGKFGRAGGHPEARR